MSDVAITDERSSSMSELDELRRRLERVENGKRPEALTDPSKNVSDRLDAAVKRIDDMAELRAKYEDKLRLQAERFQERLDVAKDRADEAARKQESERLNALRASDAAQTASALVQVTNAASNLALAAAATKETQDKQIVALQLIASSSGGTLSGREAQQAQGRQVSQWLIGVLAGAVIASGLFGASQLLKTPPTPIQVTVVAPTPAPTK